jgi:hypothetical protein
VRKTENWPPSSGRIEGYDENPERKGEGSDGSRTGIGIEIGIGIRIGKRDKSTGLFFLGGQGTSRRGKEIERS